MGSRFSTPKTPAPSSKDPDPVEATAMEFICDSCREVIAPNDPRWYCAACDEYQSSFDYCAKCIVKDPHNTPPHKMVKLEVSSVTNVRPKDYAAMTMENRFLAFRERKLLGTIVRDASNKITGFDWVTYSEVFESVQNFASGLLELIPSQSFVSICGDTSVEWSVADFACIYGTLTSVPIHTTFDQAAMEFILNSAKVSCVVVSSKMKSRFVTIVDDGHCPALKCIVVAAETLDSSDISRCKARHVDMYTVQDVMDLGSRHPKSLTKPPSKEWVATITYTSGSTGLPKGAVLTEAELNREFQTQYGFFSPLVTVAYMPLAHSMQRTTNWLTFANGGRIAIFDGEMTELFDFVSVARPSTFSAVPRVWNILYTRYKEALESEAAQVSDDLRPVVEEDIRKRFEAVLGDRVKTISFGGAPTSEDVKKWIRSTFRHCIVSEGYGATEVGGIAVNGTRRAEIEIKLVDVPELGYTSNDKPYARGELWVRRKVGRTSVFYFNDTDNTTKNFDSEGYFCTGDIVEYCSTTDRLVVIDRKKHIFKLAQGEFVAPEWLESIYNKSKYVDTIWVYGSCLQDFTLAVIVPNKATVMQWAAENGKESKDFAELVKDSTLSCAILADLIIVGRQAKVQSYEIPRGLVLEAERFSAENNMLTPSFKLNRMALTKRYSLPLDNLYEQLSKRGSTVLIEAAKQDVAKLISQATGADLASLKGATEINLAELGVDSMSAIKLKNLFKNELGMNVTVDKLLGKASLDSLAEGIISGKETIEETIDWRAEASLPADLRQLIEESSSLPRIRLDSPVNGIFITGATGFLGAFIIAQLYEEYPEAKLFCLIRAKTAQEAKTRLAASLKKLRLSEDINKSVVPVCGDLSVPYFGLPKEEFDSIARQIDRVIHNGCYVNGILTYNTLRGPNVVGTIESIRLAATFGLKPFVYISSLSALGRRFADEEFHFTKIDPDQLRVMSGYGASKQISEALCEAASTFGIEHVIIRAGTICGNSITGAVSTTDFLNKFIAGIVQLGLFPEVDSVFDMAPVDYVARAIVRMATSAKASKLVFHLYNLKSAPKVSEIAKAINTYGFSVASRSYEEWKVQLRQNEANSLTPLRSYFAGSMPQLPDYGDERSQELLAEFGLVCPPITDAVIHKWLEYLCDSGIIKRP